MDDQHSSNAQSTSKKHIPLFDAELSSVAELIRFLALYLDYETALSIKKLANEHALKPDGDTRSFVNLVKNKINKKLIDNREKLKEVAQKIISDYRNQMLNSENQIHSRASCSNESEKTEAGMKLIEGLECMIPEPKRSNFRHKALHVVKGCLEFYINDLREELDDYINDREREIQQRLHFLLEKFDNDLFVLSKQLRLVDKIEIMVEKLKKENIPEETKAKMYNMAEPIKKSLKKSKFTPSVVEMIRELTRRANGLAEKKTSKSFKKCVRELGDAVEYLFGE